MGTLIPGPFRTSWIISKILAYLVLVLVFVVAVVAIAQRNEMKLVAEFQALKLVDPLPNAKELAEAGKLCEAIDHLEYFLDYDYVKEDLRVLQYYKELKEKREALLFRAQDVVSGIWRGKGACTESMISATVSDFLVVGDVRDLVWGVVNKVRGEESDNFTMALAGVGVLLTGATVVATPASGGGAAPAGITGKVTLSMLKLAKRLEKLPKSLQNGLVKVFQLCTKTKSLKPLGPVSSSVYGISRVKGLKIPDFLTIMSRSKNIKDLQFMETVATTYGKRTGKFLKLAGDTPVNVVRKFGKSASAGRAVDTAIKYGPEGSRLLMKTGPQKFLKYVTIAKYSARTTRVLWKQRFNMTLAKLMNYLPESGVLGIAFFTGLLVFGYPAIAISRFIRRRRAKRALAAQEQAPSVA